MLLLLFWTATTVYSNYYYRQSSIGLGRETFIESHDPLFDSEANKLAFRSKVYGTIKYNDDENGPRANNDAIGKSSSIGEIRIEGKIVETETGSSSSSNSIGDEPKKIDDLTVGGKNLDELTEQWRVFNDKVKKISHLTRESKHLLNELSEMSEKDSSTGSDKSGGDKDTQLSFIDYLVRNIVRDDGLGNFDESNEDEAAMDGVHLANLIAYLSSRGKVNNNGDNRDETIVDEEKHKESKEMSSEKKKSASAEVNTEVESENEDDSQEDKNHATRLLKEFEDQVVREALLKGISFSTFSDKSDESKESNEKVKIDSHQEDTDNSNESGHGDRNSSENKDISVEKRSSKEENSSTEGSAEEENKTEDPEDDSDVDAIVMSILEELLGGPYADESTNDESEKSSGEADENNSGTEESPQIAEDEKSSAESEQLHSEEFFKHSSENEDDDVRAILVRLLSLANFDKKSSEETESSETDLKRNNESADEGSDEHVEHGSSSEGKEEIVIGETTPCPVQDFENIDDSAEDLTISQRDATDKITKYENVLIAKRLEPTVGPKGQLLRWYYENKDSPDFLHNDDVFKVMTALLLYDTNIEEFELMRAGVREFMNDDSFAEKLDELSSKDVKPETPMQTYIVDRMNKKLSLLESIFYGRKSVEEVEAFIGRLNDQELKSLGVVNLGQKESVEKSNGAHLDGIAGEKEDSEHLDISEESIEIGDKTTEVDSRELAHVSNGESDQKRKSVIDAMKKVAASDESGPLGEPVVATTQHSHEISGEESDDKTESEHVPYPISTDNDYGSTFFYDFYD